jgi:RNA polymerase sigma factor (TIGR02999 family)
MGEAPDNPSGPHAADQLLPLVYTELRRLAARQLAQERPGQTLDATALVHEAYLRLMRAGSVSDRKTNPVAYASGSLEFANRAHFYAAAAEAMRRILVERARKRATAKHGGGRRRIDVDALDPAAVDPSADLLDLDDALNELAEHDSAAAQLVTLRYFAGLTHQEAAVSLGLSRRAADRLWALARAWLYQRLTNG